MKPRKRPPDWLIEERRNALGHWAAFCLACGHALRYFEELEHELSAACPACGGELRVRCPTCDARFASAFAVDCEACARPLRPETLQGVRIRRSDK